MGKVNTLQTSVVSDTQIAKYSGISSCDYAMDHFSLTLHVIIAYDVTRLVQRKTSFCPELQIADIV